MYSQSAGCSCERRYQYQLGSRERKKDGKGESSHPACRERGEFRGAVASVVCFRACFFQFAFLGLGCMLGWLLLLLLLLHSCCSIGRGSWWAAWWAIRSDGRKSHDRADSLTGSHGAQWPGTAGATAGAILSSLSVPLHSLVRVPLRSLV